ncbi:D-hexose-6-phosphate mutarotase [Roseofilum casamattae]|uniref:Putative glucose-6-phosphate 1-epimerase n=1 Tax=Roseofilum casamattae BLCC-M143 TaxID=3022442 RepID=A0ABT7BXJ9_9CYAN|nr:D-hexose-6-phosphate mutarotase [Roseofilum casamattae]MDJ1183918.1 D-hexose-6-phosphate mutarotase [Roseofilum casamattae BLCC-M143]
MTIEQLNADYGIANQLQFIEGKGGLPIIAIANSKAKATISIYGGQVLSFQPSNAAEDVLFVSEKAYYQEGKAIKGGAPVCWPWFGPDPEGLGRPSHGFMRNRLWSVLGTETTANGDTLVKLGLTDTVETREIWPHNYELSIEFLVGETLVISSITKNTGSEPYSITQALHTYFTVGNINAIQVLGLDGANYIDKVDEMTEKQQDGAVTIAGEVDRIYATVSDKLTINDPSLSRQIQLTATGSKSAVVWNPWAEKAAKMGDLDDLEYLKFVCVETTNAGDDIVEIAPGSTHQLTVKIAAI